MGKIIALLTDFGTRDIYVGVMKGVMKRICPDAEFIDISHDVKRQSIHDGALMLSNAYSYFPIGTVFLVVVDPTVGSDRRPILVETPNYRFVAPDNGILTPILAEVDSWQAVELTKPEYQLTDGSFTFHGRDIFSPAAAYAARGDVPLTTFGDTLTDLITLPTSMLSLGKEVIRGEITHIDHFGNVITSIGKLYWQDHDTLELRTAHETRQIDARTVHITVNGVRLEQIRTAYHEVPVGQLLLQVDSNGYLEIAINQGDAAQRLNMSNHDIITLYLR
ncbi:MAG: SAM hydrolase/SAM-dependent halogenase family protein [Anaerolineae bacterium]